MDSTCSHAGNDESGLAPDCGLKELMTISPHWFFKLLTIFFHFVSLWPLKLIVKVADHFVQLIVKASDLLQFREPVKTLAKSVLLVQSQQRQPHLNDSVQRLEFNHIIKTLTWTWLEVSFDTQLTQSYPLCWQTNIQFWTLHLENWNGATILSSDFCDFIY